mgnify:CR=1 FL=1
MNSFEYASPTDLESAIGLLDSRWGETEILDLRRDADISREMVVRLAERNAATLTRRCLPVTPGTLVVDGTTITEVTIEADMTAITTNESRRDDNVHSALDTDEFPTATFVLSEPIVEGRGRIRIDDSIWQVRGPDAPAGARVVVTGADGTILNVTMA